MEEIKQQKNKIRDSVLWQYKELDLEALADCAVELASKEKPFLDANTVFVYKPFGHEIPFINKLMEKFPSKEYYFPIMEGRKMNFEHGEPDIIFVPAIAVDKDSNRLGRGGGSYDKFLSNLGLQGPIVDVLTICVVPECGVVDNLPIEPHDVAVNKIIVCKQ